MIYLNAIDSQVPAFDCFKKAYYLSMYKYSFNILYWDILHAILSRPQFKLSKLLHFIII